MRFIPTAILVVILFLIISAMPVQASDAESSDGLLISRVCASYPGEFISLTNHGPSLDVLGWRISDGEGSVTFSRSLIITTGGSVTWSAPGSFFPELYAEEDCFSNDGASVILKGSLKLADAGDQVYLFDAGGALRDMVCFGNVEPNPPWTGPPAVLKKGSVIVRTATGNGPGNWDMMVPGLFSLSSPLFPADVVPLLYPDDALPELVRQIDISHESIQLACYLMENWTLARHLAGASARGLNVTVLLEGRPVGGVSENGAALAYYLQDSGVNVWTMRSGESFRRYDYLHAKYAIFDRERLFVASENMADSSFNSNRGWAAVIMGSQISSFAEDVFLKDISAKGVDIFPLSATLVRADGGPGRLLSTVPAPPREYSAMVSLVTSPFNIQDRLVEMISAAQERVLVQQMRIDEDWIDDSKIMSVLSGAAERGVSVRIHLDAGLGTEKGNKMVAEALNRKAKDNDWDLECHLTDEISSFGRLHNKGVIVDDTVVVGSANWVDGSMQRNREMAVVLRSADLANVFVQWFQDDWKGDAIPPTVVLPWHYLEANAGEPVVLDATGCYDPSGIANITWDVDGDGSADLFGPMHAVTLREGSYNITLRLEDALGNVALDNVTVLVNPSSDGTVTWLLYAPLPLLLAVILFKRRTRRL